MTNEDHESTVFDLLKEDMDRGMREMEAILARDFFRSERPLFASYYSTPPSRWQRAYWRTRGYLLTLWRALRGEELDTPTDDY